MLALLWPLFEQVIEPHVGKLFLSRVLAQARIQIIEIYAIQRLVLVVAGVHKVLPSGCGIDVLAQALRAHTLHHALHR